MDLQRTAASGLAGGEFQKGSTSVLRVALAAQPGVVTAEQLARGFSRARTEVVAGLLQTFVSLGLAREIEAGRLAL